MNVPRKNALEWAVFGLSLALVATVVGFLVFAAAPDADAPPRLAAAAGAPVPMAEGVRVPITLRNDGAQAVASAVVEVTDGRATATVTFGYVPRQGEREGAVHFATPPGPLRARVTSYELP